MFKILIKGKNHVVICIVLILNSSESTPFTIETLSIVDDTKRSFLHPTHHAQLLLILWHLL